MSTLHYKGYFGSIEFNEEGLIFYGKVQFIKALISYEGESARELKVAFEEAVDDYLQTCHKHQIKPEIPFKGSLNIRIGHALHREAALQAERLNLSLNRFICDAIAGQLHQQL
jgi:predicted HicB family RNase H-like nuclease